jgi:hypothetical protein
MASQGGERAERSYKKLDIVCAPKALVASGSDKGLPGLQPRAKAHS